MDIVNIILSHGAIRAAPTALERIAEFATERMKARLERLPFCATHAVVALFPGRVSIGEKGGDYGQNDERLRAASRVLEGLYPEHHFYASGNAYPLPAVQAARLAGLGVIGINGLLNTPAHGTSVTIGAVLTDFPLPCGIEIAEDEGYCSKCGLCIEKCPSGALSYDGGVRQFERAKCLSHRYQKEGLQPPAEGYYGCDICQNVCPMNATGSLS